MSTANKMRLKDGMLYVLKAPTDCLALFDGFEQENILPGKQAIGQVVLFAQNKKVLDDTFPRLAPKLEDDALLWIAYPKKSGKIPSDITRDDGWEAVIAAGYVAVTQVAIDDNWSALRFRKTGAIGPKLRDITMKDRVTEGVDYIKRTVTLPADAEKALKKHKGLADFFYSLSFSHKKEHTQAITEAKKEETRTRRIEKMIEMLLKMRTEKEKKK